MPKNNAFFSFSSGQKKGLILLFGIIILLQSIYYFVDFRQKEVELPPQKWLSLQNEIDSLKANKPTTSFQMYPFNPNFITDFKGYKLGMKPQEIQRLLRFRKTGKYVNSVREFQSVTGVSDSLMRAISPYFKFPDWVTHPKYKKDEEPKKWIDFSKKPPIKIKDINQASKEDLMAVYGIGDVISDRILQQKNQLGGFVSMDQMEDIWGLSPEVIQKLDTYFTVTSTTSVKKININTATIKELGAFPYFKYPISKNIVVFRSMNGRLKIEDLTKIKQFPVDKIKIIVLYLEY